MVATKDLTTSQRALAARLIELAEESLGRGAVAEAERLYREVLHFLELILCADHVEIAKTLYKLAYILEYQEKNSESFELIRRARTIIRNVRKEEATVENIFSPFVWERPS